MEELKKKQVMIEIDSQETKKAIRKIAFDNDMTIKATVAMLVKKYNEGNK